MEVTEERRRKQLLDDLKDKKGCWKFKQETLDRTVWGIRLRRVSGPDVRLRN
jgi:hypothetical protein